MVNGLGANETYYYTNYVLRDGLRINEHSDIN